MQQWREEKKIEEYSAGCEDSTVISLVGIFLMETMAPATNIGAQSGRLTLSKALTTLGNSNMFLGTLGGEEGTTEAEWGFPLTPFDVRCIVKQYLDKKGATEKRFKNNLPGDDWYRSFLQRHNGVLSLRLSENIKRSRAQVSKEVLVDYFNNLAISLQDVPPELIVNFDKTNLVDDPGRSKVLVRKGYVAFFRPLKICWRQCLQEWKTKNKGTIPKSVFPQRLNQMLKKLEPAIAKNLQSGFRGTGIFPLNPEEVLRLPGSTEHTAHQLSDSFEKYLREIRFESSTSKKRKRRLNVEAGKSVNETCIQARSDSDPASENGAETENNEEIEK
ncbi:hypothetical protein ANN_18488 [Periplaneta americana]|uniref:Uncharacterized protein n=1 Tax=Periplaneta americana TaxID=6978 RepID=A0ABQ8SNW2_PERAM|nr:hypothetical protein ANN_18488 [Periplaneta americana]